MGIADGADGVASVAHGRGHGPSREPVQGPPHGGLGIKFLRECTADRARKNTLVKLRLAQYSQRKLNEIAEAERIDYDDIHAGLLYLYRDPKRMAAGVEKWKLIRDHGNRKRSLARMMWPRSSRPWRL